MGYFIVVYSGIISEAVTGSVPLEKLCSQKFLKIHSKTPVLKSFFNKVVDQPGTFLAQVLCCEFCEISDNTFLTEHL